MREEGRGAKEKEGNLLIPGRRGTEIECADRRVINLPLAFRVSFLREYSPCRFAWRPLPPACLAGECCCACRSSVALTRVAAKREHWYCPRQKLPSTLIYRNFDCRVYDRMISPIIENEIPITYLMIIEIKRFYETFHVSVTEPTELAL